MPTTKKRVKKEDRGSLFLIRRTWTMTDMVMISAKSADRAEKLASRLETIPIAIGATPVEGTIECTIVPRD